MVEELIREENLSDFYRSSRSRDVVYVAHRCANSHGRVLELLEYGVGQQSFIVIPEGHGCRGWSDCVEQRKRTRWWLMAEDRTLTR